MIPLSTNIIPILQLSVSPVILISAVGLIILTLNNRLAHSIDRLRLLLKEKSIAEGQAKEKLDYQIAIIYHRAKIARWSIMFILISALFSSLLIILLFITTLLDVSDPWVYSICFIAALLFLIAGLTFFAWEVNTGLEALNIEIENQK